MNLDLHNKNAFVGGGSKGIGLACAQELALLGANVTLVSRTENDLSDSLKTLDISQNQKHHYLVLDYGNINDIENKVSKELTIKSYHILVNNTGGPAGGPIEKAENAAFLDALQKHLLVNHTLTQLLLPGMKASNYGRIINIISTSVKIPLNGLGVSNTTRGAVASWAKTMANELGIYGITVNNVLPGATATDRLESIISNNAKKMHVDEKTIEENMRQQIPLKRFAEPNEVGALVAFLASPAAAYISGTSTPVDGGRTGSI